MDGRCWSSTPAHRGRPERQGRDQSCYRPELSPKEHALSATTSGSVIARAVALEHALSIGCQLSVLAPPPEPRGRALSPTAHSASLPALLPGSGAPRSYWVLPKPKPDRRSTPARPSPTRTVAASAQPAVGAAGTAAAQRAPDARLGGEDAAALHRAALHRHVMRVLEPPCII